MIAARLHALAQDGGATAPVAGDNPGTLLLVLALMTLLPFALTMTTSFARLVIVGGILRQALGTQQVPPTSVLTGMALILTLVIMGPVAERVLQRMPATLDDGPAVARVVVDELGGFMQRNTDPQLLQQFRELRRSAPAADAALPERSAGTWRPLLRELLELLTVQAPAFMVGELSKAFLMGVFLFIPFLVIDLVVSNLLLTMGMQMMSPVTVALPLKLLVFVSANGWNLLIETLVRNWERG